AWRTRKRAEARELVALAEIAPPARMRIDYLDLADELRLGCRLGVPAAVRGADGTVRVTSGATIGLIVPEQSLTEQSRGFVEILDPPAMFHPAVAALPPLPQALCLGAVQAGTRATEVVLIAYSALAMQNLQLDAFE